MSVLKSASLLFLFLYLIFLPGEARSMGGFSRQKTLENYFAFFQYHTMRTSFNALEIFGAREDS